MLAHMSARSGDSPELLGGPRAEVGCVFGARQQPPGDEATGASYMPLQDCIHFLQMVHLQMNKGVVVAVADGPAHLKACSLAVSHATASAAQGGMGFGCGVHDQSAPFRDELQFAGGAVIKDLLERVVPITAKFTRQFAKFPEHAKHLAEIMHSGLGTVCALLSKVDPASIRQRLWRRDKGDTHEAHVGEGGAPGAGDHIAGGGGPGSDSDDSGNSGSHRHGGQSLLTPDRPVGKFTNVYTALTPRAWEGSTGWLCASLNFLMAIHSLSDAVLMTEARLIFYGGGQGTFFSRYVRLVLSIKGKQRLERSSSKRGEAEGFGQKSIMGAFPGCSGDPAHLVECLLHTMRQHDPSESPSCRRSHPHPRASVSDPIHNIFGFKLQKTYTCPTCCGTYYITRDLHVLKIALSGMQLLRGDSVTMSTLVQASLSPRRSANQPHMCVRGLRDASGEASLLQHFALLPQVLLVRVNLFSKSGNRVSFSQPIEVDLPGLTILDRRNGADGHRTPFSMNYCEESMSLGGRVGWVPTAVIWHDGGSLTEGTFSVYAWRLVNGVGTWVHVKACRETLLQGPYPDGHVPRPPGTSVQPYLVAFTCSSDPLNPSGGWSRWVQGRLSLEDTVGVSWICKANSGHSASISGAKHVQRKSKW
mmetsp:Transcript_2317/g.6548  ORF Transcript_2317/g.6548 Transcript_2317/m.6548 type:complete len:645 (-) Transcript_2317:1549-3483(-)